MKKIDPKEILNAFKGKQIEHIMTDGEYELHLKCIDGSILSVVNDGPEGSRFKVVVNVRIERTIDCS